MGKKLLQAKRKVVSGGRGRRWGRGRTAEETLPFLSETVTKSHTERPCLIFGRISRSFTT